MKEKGGNAMITENGNAKDANRKWADFVGRVCQALWSAFKPAIESGKFDLSKFNTVQSIRSALRRGFLIQEKTCATELSLNIGKVSKEDLAKLSVWDLKNLHEFFYQQVFGLSILFPDELMPEASDELAWPICVPGVISNEASYRSGNSGMSTWKFAEKALDSVMKLDRGRDALTRSYIVCTPPNFEAGEKLKNISGNDIDKRGDDVLMFRERWILGMFIFWLTGLHLDRDVVTGTGSRFSGGNVVGVDFRGGRVCVDAYDPDDAFGSLRFREAVS